MLQLFDGGGSPLSMSRLLLITARGGSKEIPNKNIMAWFREAGGISENSPEAILISYELQTGSYLETMKDLTCRKLHDDPGYDTSFKTDAGNLSGVIA
jgi:hypothetical protein